jgi:hypothetical protein
MQHTRTPIGAVSMRFSILDLMAAMFCHVVASSGRDILDSEISDQFSVKLQIAARQLYMAQGSEVYVDGHGVWSRTTS